MKQCYCLASLILFISCLNGCAPFKLSDKRAGLCNELNSRIIFSGNTSNNRAAEISNSEEALAQRSYENSGCAS